MSNDRARRTLVVTRGFDQTHLSAEVASLLPSLAAEARVAVSKASKQGRHRPSATFCPMCHGTKTVAARRCHKCRDEAMSRGAGEARAHGKHSMGRHHAARSLVEPAPTNERAADPYLTTQHAGRGGRPGTKPPWKRHVLIDGRWTEAPDR